MESDGALESGYGTATPSGDNLLNDYVQGEAAAFVELARARDERVAEDEEFGLIMTDGGSPSPFGNVAVLRRPLLEHEWPEAARRMHAFYRQRAGGPYMTFCGWPTPDVRAFGFAAVGHPPLMLRPPGPLTAPGPEGFEVVPVRDAATARDFERAMVAGYPIPEIIGDPTGTLVGTDPRRAPRWQHFVGVLHGETVATGSAFVDERHVHIDFISTLAEHRRRGIGYAITAAATLAAPELPALLIASDFGRPVYERLGYVTMLRFTLWAGQREDAR